MLGRSVIFRFNSPVQAGITNWDFLNTDFIGGEVQKNSTTTMLSFRVDTDTAEYLKEYARIRHTTVSEVLRNWSKNCDLKIFLPVRARDKLEIIAKGRKNMTPGRLIESAIANRYRILGWYNQH